MQQLTASLNWRISVFARQISPFYLNILMSSNLWRATALLTLLACPALVLGQHAPPTKAPSQPVPAPVPAALGTAQVAPPEPEEKTYTYVEIMPTLPGEVSDHSAAGSQRALTQELQRLLVVPAGTKAGMVFVEFTVQPTGLIHNAHIFKSLNPVADAAALQAISKLPTLQPGKQNGRLVAVRYILALKVPSGS